MTSTTDKSSPSTLIPPEFVAIGKTRIEEFAKAQCALLERVRDMNRKWIDRWQAEAMLLSDFSAKLTSARSIVETTTAYQNLASRQKPGHAFFPTAGRRVDRPSALRRLDESRAGRRAPMEMRSTAEESPNIPSEERVISELIKRIRKLRWIGREQEAEQLKLLLRHMPAE